MDTRRRSWAKSITWRLAGVVILGFISYAFTRDWGATTGITVVFHTIRLVLYYTHERLWERVSWGRITHPLAHLQLRDDLTSEEVCAIQELLRGEEYLAEGPEYQI